MLHSSNNLTPRLHVILASTMCSFTLVPSTERRGKAELCNLSKSFVTHFCILLAVSHCLCYCLYMCSTKSFTSIPFPHPDFVGNGPTFVYTSQRSDSPISPNASSSSIKRVSSFTHFTVDEEKQVEYFFASDARWAPCGVLQSYISSFLFHHTVT